MSFLLSVSLITILVVAGCKYKSDGYNEDYLSLAATNAWKGIAAIYIVIHHLSQNIDLSGPFIIFRYIGFILVAVFYFFSGYGLAYSLRNKKNYLEHFFINRILPVLLPYWIVNLVCITLRCVLADCPAPHQLILSFFGLDTVTNTWFVTSILILYCIYYLSFQYIPRFVNGRQASHLALIIGVVGYSLVCYCLKLGSSWIASVSAFLLGAFWHRMDDKVVSFVRKNIWISIIASAVLFAVLFLGRLLLANCVVGNEFVHFLLRNVVSCSFVLFLICISQKIILRAKWFQHLGKLSYCVYLVHYVLIYFTNSYSIYPVYVPAIIVVSLALSWLLDILYRKTFMFVKAKAKESMQENVCL